MSPSIEDLSSELTSLLGSPVSDISRSPCVYASSFALQELLVTLGNGARLPMMFKDMSLENMYEAARRLKPEFIYDPNREIEVYRRVLSPAKLGAEFYGAVVEPGRGRHWLFIERVPGTELYQIGETEIWCDVSRWLARLHAVHRKQAQTMAETLPLLRITADYCKAWVRRAEELLSDPDLSAISGWPMIRRSYEQAIDRILSIPPTFIHGEFYASNVLVVTEDRSRRVCPVDWEVASIGPGAMDLAGLTSGQWNETGIATLVDAYLDAYASEAGTSDSGEPDGAFLFDLDCCRLHQAIQWLGYFGARPAYREHRCDWLAEACRLAERLNP